MTFQCTRTGFVPWSVSWELPVRHRSQALFFPGPILDNVDQEIVFHVPDQDIFYPFDHAFLSNRHSFFAAAYAPPLGPARSRTSRALEDIQECPVRLVKTESSPDRWKDPSSPRELVLGHPDEPLSASRCRRGSYGTPCHSEFISFDRGEFAYGCDRLACAEHKAFPPEKADVMIKAMTSQTLKAMSSQPILEGSDLA